MIQDVFSGGFVVIEDSDVAVLEAVLRFEHIGQFSDILDAIVKRVLLIVVYGNSKKVVVASGEVGFLLIALVSDMFVLIFHAC